MNKFCCFFALTIVVFTSNIWADTPTFKIAVTESFEPYIINDKGVWSGIDIDINRELMARLGYEPEYIGVPWLRQLALVETGKAAAILTAYCDDKRPYLQMVEEPYYEVSISLFSGVEYDKKIDRLEDIPRGTRVGVVKGNFFTEWLVSMPFINTIMLYNSPSLIHQFARGGVELVLEEYAPMVYNADKLGYAGKFKELSAIDTNTVCIALSKPYFDGNAGAITERMIEIIQQLKKEGFVLKTLEKYLGEEAKR